jgi:hypothetical protein
VSASVSQSIETRAQLAPPTIAMRGGALPVGAIMPAIRKGTNAHTPAVMPVAAAFPFPDGITTGNEASYVENDSDLPDLLAVPPFPGNGTTIPQATRFVRTNIYNIQAPGVRAGTAQNNALWFRTTTEIATNGVNESLNRVYGWDPANAITGNDIGYGFGGGNGNPIFLLTDEARLTNEDYQPLVLPVTQLNVPSAAHTATDLLTVTRNDADFLNGGGVNSGRWTEEASNTIVNAIFVAGGSPSRTYSRYDLVAGTPNYTNEGGGDLPNFIRLMENWSGRNLRIIGGFFQNRKSQFATGPYTPTYPFRNAALVQSIPGSYNEPETQSIYRDYIGLLDRAASSFNGNKESYISRTSFGIPYYFPPSRVFGYDVGILSVSPNYFDSLFVAPTPGANEYFREVNRDDPYVKTLLCAVQNPLSRTGGTVVANNVSIYNKFTIAEAQLRPDTCQAAPNYP